MEDTMDKEKKDMDVPMEVLEETYNRIFQFGRSMEKTYEEIIQLAKDKSYLGPKYDKITKEMDSLYRDHRENIVRFILLHDVTNQQYLTILHDIPAASTALLKSMTRHEQIFREVDRLINIVYDNLLKNNV
jgi:hypothetical protein